MYPHPKLTQKVPEVDFCAIKEDTLNSLSASMLGALPGFKALGLAANQIGLDMGLFVMKLESKEPLVIINPVILEKTVRAKSVEGCLSIPSSKLPIFRASKLTLEFYNTQGHKQTRKFSGLDAFVIQHEIDHLNGISLFDHIKEETKTVELIKLNRWKIRNKYVD
jgi:peptide deformylase